MANPKVIIIIEPLVVETEMVSIVVKQSTLIKLFIVERKHPHFSDNGFIYTTNWRNQMKNSFEQL